MPNPEDFDFPIIELEDDSPQQVGKVGLYDYIFPVGNSGIHFKAAIAGLLYTWGPSFQPAATKLAQLRAASTLVQWGLISPDIFAFQRSSIQLSQSDVAAILGVDLATVQAWENGTTPIPRLMWQEIAARVCKADQRPLPPELAPCINPETYRHRTIRIFPNVPSPPQPPPPCPCDPCPQESTFDCEDPDD